MKKENFAIRGIRLSTRPSRDLDEGCRIVNGAVRPHDDDLQTLHGDAAFENRRRDEVSQPSFLETTDDFRSFLSFGRDVIPARSQITQCFKDALGKVDARNENEASDVDPMSRTR